MRRDYLPAYLLSSCLMFWVAGDASAGAKSKSTASASSHVAATTPLTKEGQKKRGIASWYGGKFHGRQTASGETFHARKLTAAHRTLPFGSTVAVTNLKNGKSVRVRITDRGPKVKRRIIDLSYAAARTVGLVKMGTAPVEVRVLSLPSQ